MHCVVVASNRKVQVIFHRELCFQVLKTQMYQSRQIKGEEKKDETTKASKQKGTLIMIEPKIDQLVKSNPHLVIQERLFVSSKTTQSLSQGS